MPKKMTKRGGDIAGEEGETDSSGYDQGEVETREL